MCRYKTAFLAFSSNFRWKIILQNNTVILFNTPSRELSNFNDVKSIVFKIHAWSPMGMVYIGLYSNHCQELVQKLYHMCKGMSACAHELVYANYPSSRATAHCTFWKAMRKGHDTLRGCSLPPERENRKAP